MKQPITQPERGSRDKSEGMANRARQELIDALALLVVRQHRRQTRMGVESPVTGAARPSLRARILGER